jgi:hypothetical protein
MHDLDVLDTIPNLLPIHSVIYKRDYDQNIKIHSIEKVISSDLFVRVFNSSGECHAPKYKSDVGQQKAPSYKRCYIHTTYIINPSIGIFFKSFSRLKFFFSSFFLFFSFLFFSFLFFGEG